jgi:hypothetical protein
MISKLLSLFNGKKPKRFKPLQISELTPTEKEIVKCEYEEIQRKIADDNEKIRMQKHELAKLRNEKCPHCFSKNVNNRISRIQGSLSGSSHGSMAFGFGSSSGSIRGTLDTNEVNKCNDCQHEWKVENPFDYSYTSIYEVMKTLSRQLRRIEKILKGDVKWNPNDLDEKCKTKEEKIQQEIKYYTNPENYANKDIFVFLSGASLETINYLVEIKLGEYPTLNEREINDWTYNTDYQMLADYFNIKSLRTKRIENF